MKSAWKLGLIVFLATSLVAQTSTEPKSKKTKPRAAAVTAADVQALKDAIASQQAALTQQQQQIQELRDALQRKDQAVQQVQVTATDAAGKADAAQAQASQQQQTVGELKSDVSDLKTNLLNTTTTIQETQKTLSEPPTAIHYKGITITPGGFVAAEFVRRSRALGADINTPFNSLTMPGASQSSISEFFGSGRQSRLSLLAEGQLKSAKLAGYYEADFLSAAVTSNNNQSNSYSLRQRQAWGQVAFNSGLTLTCG
jgi:multidrug efflux pump subunit AcrA (membrane-fusion protein)